MSYRVNIDNIEMNYLKFGRGEKNLVVLPGISLKPVTQSEEAVVTGFSMFCEEFTVYLFDRKLNLSEQYSIKDMAEDTIRVLSSLGVDKFYIFGNSQGGGMALYMASNYPERVEKVVASGSFGRVNDNSSKIIERWYKLAKDNKKDELVSSMVDMIYGEETLSKYRDIIIASFSDITEKDISDFAVTCIACNNFDMYRDLKKIRCETLVVGAEGDRVVPIETQKELAKEIPNGMFYEYGKMYGHSVCDEAPDFRSRMFDFFTKR